MSHVRLRDASGDNPCLPGREGALVLCDPHRGNALLVLGGRCGPRAYADVWMANPPYTDWTCVQPSCKWRRRAFFGGFVIAAAHAVIMGGEGVAFDSWETLDGGVSWVKVSHSASGEQMYGFHTMHRVGTSEALLMGGALQDGDKMRVRLYSPSGVDLLETGSTVCPESRMHGGWIDTEPDTVLLVGGRCMRDSRARDDVWECSVRSRCAHWTLIQEECPWGPRYGHRVARLGDKALLLVGGRMVTPSGSKRFAMDMWRSKDGGRHWSKVVPPVPFPGMYNFAAHSVLDNSHVLIIGGRRQNQTYSDQLWVLRVDSASDQCQSVPLDDEQWIQLHATPPPVAELPVAELPVAEPPVAEPPVAEPPVAEPPPSAAERAMAACREGDCDALSAYLASEECAESRTCWLLRFRTVESIVCTCMEGMTTSELQMCRVMDAENSFSLLEWAVRLQSPRMVSILLARGWEVRAVLARCAACPPLFEHVWARHLTDEQLEAPLLPGEETVVGACIAQGRAEWLSTMIASRGVSLERVLQSCRASYALFRTLLLAHATETNVNAVSCGGTPLLRVACDENDLEMVRTLMSKKADPMRVDAVSNRTTLATCMEKADVAFVRAVAPGVPAEHAQCVFEHACMRGDAELCRMMAPRARVEERHLVDFHRSPAIVGVLIQHIPNATLKRSMLPYGRTLLHVACEMGETDLVFELLRRGADLSAKDAMRKTALHIALDNQRMETVTALCARGPLTNVNGVFWSGKTLLAYLVERGQNDAATQLLTRADVRASMVPVWSSLDGSSRSQELWSAAKCEEEQISVELSPQLSTASWFDSRLLLRVPSCNVVWFRPSTHMRVWSGAERPTSPPPRSSPQDEPQLCATFLLRLEHPCGRNGLSIHPMRVAFESGQSTAFDSIALRAIIHHKWTTYGRSFFAVEGALFLVLLAAFSFQHHLVAFVIALAFIMKECVNCFENVRYAMAQQRGTLSSVTAYLRDPWNVLDVLGLSGVMASIFATDHPLALAATALALWCKLLYYLRAIEATASFVTTVVQAFQDMRSFLALVVILIVGFAHAFYLLLQKETFPLGEGHVPDDMQSMLRSVSTTYRMILGDFDSQLFIQSPHWFSAGVFFVLFTSIMTIVVLNLLISLLGDTFERVQEYKVQLMAFERAAILIDMDPIVYLCLWKRTAQVFPRFLTVAVPVQDAFDVTEDQAHARVRRDDQDSWSGRISSIKSHVDQRVSELRVLIMEEQKRATRTPSRSLAAEEAAQRAVEDRESV
jgi:ankyrin repeat protein